MSKIVQIGPQTAEIEPSEPKNGDNLKILKLGSHFAENHPKYAENHPKSGYELAVLPDDVTLTNTRPHIYYIYYKLAL